MEEIASVRFFSVNEHYFRIATIPKQSSEEFNWWQLITQNQPFCEVFYATLELPQPFVVRSWWQLITQIQPFLEINKPVPDTKERWAWI